MSTPWYNVSPLFIYKIYPVYWPEGGAVSQYSMSLSTTYNLLAVNGQSKLRNAICASTETPKVPNMVFCRDHYSVLRTRKAMDHKIS